jgi:hypothetical protein
MRALALAVVTGLIRLPFPTTAAQPSTDISAQSIQIRLGGVRVHDRWESRRRDRRCVPEYVTRTRPSGRVIRENCTICR